MEQERSKHQTVDFSIFCFAKTFPYASSIGIELGNEKTECKYFHYTNTIQAL